MVVSENPPGGAWGVTVAYGLFFLEFSSSSMATPATSAIIFMQVTMILGFPASLYHFAKSASLLGVFFKSVVV